MTIGRNRRTMVITETTGGRFIVLGFDWPRLLEVSAQDHVDYYDHKQGRYIGTATTYNVKIRGYPGLCRMVVADDLATAVRVMGNEMQRDPGEDPGGPAALPAAGLHELPHGR